MPVAFLIQNRPQLRIRIFRREKITRIRNFRSSHLFVWIRPHGKLQIRIFRFKENLDPKFLPSSKYLFSGTWQPVAPESGSVHMKTADPDFSGKNNPDPKFLPSSDIYMSVHGSQKPRIRIRSHKNYGSGFFRGKNSESEIFTCCDIGLQIKAASSLLIRINLNVNCGSGFSG